VAKPKHEHENYEDMFGEISLLIMNMAKRIKEMNQVIDYVFKHVICLGTILLDKNYITEEELTLTWEAVLEIMRTDVANTKRKNKKSYNTKNSILPELGNFKNIIDKQKPNINVEELFLNLKKNKEDEKNE
jgi:hypothetical protein